MPDDGLGFVLVLVDKLLGAGESNLVDVLIDLLGRHAYTMVADGECLLILINSYAYADVAKLAFEHTGGGQSLEFLRGVHSVADQLTKKNLVIGIQEFFDDGEDVV